MCFGDFGFYPLGGFMGFGLILIIIVLVVIGIKRGWFNNLSKEETAYDIASKRLAKGEITKEEFKEIISEIKRQ